MLKFQDNANKMEQYLKEQLEKSKKDGASNIAEMEKKQDEWKKKLVELENTKKLLDAKKNKLENESIDLKVVLDQMKKEKDLAVEEEAKKVIMQFYTFAIRLFI